MTHAQRESLACEIESCHRDLRFAARSVHIGDAAHALVALGAAAITIERLRHALDDETCCIALCAELEVDALEVLEA